MQLKSWLMKCVRQDCKYFLLYGQEICSIKLIAKLGSLQYQGKEKENKKKRISDYLSGYVKPECIFQTPHLKIF